MAMLNYFQGCGCVLKTLPQILHHLLARGSPGTFAAGERGEKGGRGCQGL